jgi:hypothetical protein
LLFPLLLRLPLFLFLQLWLLLPLKLLLLLRLLLHFGGSGGLPPGAQDFAEVLSAHLPLSFANVFVIFAPPSSSCKLPSLLDLPKIKQDNTKMNNTKFSTDNQPQTTTRTRRTIDQEIEDLEKKLALKRESLRKAETNQKIIIGGMMLALAEHDPAVKKRLVELLEKNVTRPADVKRIEPLLVVLKDGKAQTVNAKGAEKTT